MSWRATIEIAAEEDWGKGIGNDCVHFYSGNEGFEVRFEREEKK